MGFYRIIFRDCKKCFVLIRLRVGKSGAQLRKKLHTGKLYLPGDKEITERQMKCLDKLYDFNMTCSTELEKREKMLKEMFAEIGEGCYIEPPFLSETYKICAVHVLPGVFGMAHNKNAYIHRNSWLGAVVF